MALINTNSTLVTTLSAVFQNVTIKATLDAYGPAGGSTYYGYDFSASVFGTFNTAFTINNKGVIESVAKSNYDAGILLASFGSITNSGTIIGSEGIDEFGVSGHAIVDNSGLIEGSYGSAIYIASQSDALVDNTGTILAGGGTGVGVLGGDGVAVMGGGAVYNDNAIAAVGYGVIFTGSLPSYVLNKGAIIAGAAGVEQLSQGEVVNTGAIYGYYEGVFIAGVGSVNNSGTIGGSNYGVDLYPSGGTILNSGVIEASGIAVYTGSDSFGVTGTIVNAKSGLIFAEYGVDMEGGGSISNAGTVFGLYLGVAAAGDLTLTNAGTVDGYLGLGVAVVGDYSALITNSSTISAEYTAIYAGDGASLTLTNTGTILGGLGIGEDFELADIFKDTFAAAVGVSGDALIDNLGLISGGLTGIYADGDTVTVTNAGSIVGATDFGIDLYNNFTDTVTNSGLLKGGRSGMIIEYADDVTVTNTGSIIGTEYAGVGLYQDLDVTVTNGKVISGSAAGVDVDDFYKDYFYSLDSYATIHNTGTIVGGAGDGVALVVVNANVNNTKLITGLIDGVSTYNRLGGYDTESYLGQTDVTNTGTIYGTLASGIDVADGAAYVTNKGLIYGGAYGIYSSYFMELTNTGTVDGKYSTGISVDDQADIDNSGVIKSAAYGIEIRGDLFLSNSSTGTLSGTYGSAIFAEGYASISNAGAILSKRADGIFVENDVFISNASTGLIKGIKGILVSDNYVGATTIVNAGTIDGTKYDGVHLDHGGTVDNTGTIIGKEYAVYFDLNTSANLLILSTNAKLEGKVYLGDGELELLSGSSVGTIGLGTVAGIGSINIASKADWDLAGHNTLGSLVSITNAGTIVEGASDSLTIDGSLTGGGTIEIGSLGLALNGYVGGQSLLFSGNNETLKLGDIGGGYDSFSGVIENFVKSDTIDITGLSLSDITGTAFSHGVLTISATNEYYITFAHPNSFTSLALAYFADGSGVGITLTAVNTEIARMDFATPASSSAASTAAAVASSPAVYAATASAPAITASSTSVGLSHDLLKSAASHTAVPQVTLHA